MARTLTFLHTSAVHIATFSQLMQELAPDIPVQHVVDEELLIEARTAGSVTPAVQERIAAAIDTALDRHPGMLVCTCSTIGGAAEDTLAGAGNPVMRIDRPMAERAVAAGGTIVVLATLASTLQPTRELLEQAAQRAGQAVRIIERLCPGAWSKFEAGDQAGYLADVADEIATAAQLGDVVVLAQASMAAAASQDQGAGVPILSSLRLGVEAAIRRYRAG